MIATRRPRGREPGQRSKQMARAGIAVFAALGAAREGRVHQHHAGADRRVEEVVDQLAVMAAELGARKGLGEAAPPPGIDLVEDEAAIGAGGGGGEQSRSGRRLEHDVGQGKTGRASGQPRQRKRRRKGLQRDLLLGAMGLGRQRAGERFKAGEGRYGLATRRSGSAGR